MIADFGYGVIVIAFVVALYSVGAAIYGERTKSANWVESARRAMLLLWPLISLSALSLIYLLVTNHFEVSFVYEVTSRAMPTYLKITAWWGGQAGSLVFWSWLMAAFASLVTLRKWDRDREFLPWVIVVTSITTAFFLGLVVFYQNPFAFYWSGANGNLIADALGNPITSMFAPIAGASIYFPSDGNGLNPLLRHPGMIIHPPMLYLGFVSFVIPFAFAIAALITGRSDDRWIRITRRWTLVAWLFLSLGLILGMRWAYDVLGWGGYWGWDPVEIAAFMPWLTGTAFLHSVMIQEKRGMFKRWNCILIILTYALVIYGTFLTRSGVLSSVNNLLFMGVLVVCFWGVNYPLVSELFTNQQVTVGPPFYQSATGPLFAGLLLLMGIAPLSAWGRSTYKTLGRALWKPVLASLVILAAVYISGVHLFGALLGFWLCNLVLFITLYEFYRGVVARHRRSGESLPVALVHLAERNRGGYIIHLGVVLFAIGNIGMVFYQTQTQQTVPAGGSLAINGYQVTYLSLAQFDTEDGRNVARAVLEVSKNGLPLGELYPRRDYYYDSQQPVTIPGVRSTLDGDLYVDLVDWQPITAQGATFKIFYNPLVDWLWLGGFVFILGTLVAAWPDREQEAETETDRVARPDALPGRA